MTVLISLLWADEGCDTVNKVSNKVTKFASESDFLLSLKWNDDAADSDGCKWQGFTLLLEPNVKLVLCENTKMMYSVIEAKETLTRNMYESIPLKTLQDVYQKCIVHPQ